MNLQELVDVNAGLDLDDTVDLTATTSDQIIQEVTALHGQPKPPPFGTGILTGRRLAALMNIDTITVRPDYYRCRTQVFAAAPKIQT